MIENDQVPLGWQAIRTSGPQWFYDWMAAVTLPKTLRLAEASSFNTHRSSEFCSECSNSAAMAKLIGESQILRLISVLEVVQQTLAPTLQQPKLLCGNPCRP